MSDEEFIEIMNSQERVIAGSNVHLKMHSLAQRAMGITSMINNNEPVIKTSEEKTNSL